MNIRVWVETVGAVSDGTWTHYGRIQPDPEKVRRAVRAALRKKGIRAKRVELFTSDGRAIRDNWLVDSGRFVACKF
jgi:hypothetical protein